MRPTSKGIRGAAGRHKIAGLLGLGLGRPREVYVLVARIETDVAIHFQVGISARRIGIDRRRVGEIRLILLEVVAGKSAGKATPPLGNALAFEPVGSMLPHRVSEDG